MKKKEKFTKQGIRNLDSKQPNGRQYRQHQFETLSPRKLICVHCGLEIHENNKVQAYVTEECVKVGYKVYFDDENED
jgi:hypothetical protein